MRKGSDIYTNPMAGVDSFPVDPTPNIWLLPVIAICNSGDLFSEGVIECPFASTFINVPEGRHGPVILIFELDVFSHPKNG